MLRFRPKQEASASEPARQSKLKLVMHVGPHKTGTSSLQWALQSQYSAKQPQRLWYPKPRSLGPGHALAAHASLELGSSAREPFLRDWIDTARQSECETLIVSAEALSAAYPDKVGKLAAQTEDCDIHLVFTLTPISRRSMSLWQGKVKHRFDRPLDAAGNDVLNSPGLAADLIDVFADAFPAAKISVIVVNRQSPLDLYRRFAEATGIPLLPPQESSELVVNRSLGRVEAEMVRSFNLSVAQLDLSDEDYRAGLRLLRELLTSDGWQAAVPSLPLALPDDWVEPLAERCVATLANLRKLEAEGRIEILGDVDSLNDIDAVRRQVKA
ncbi:MAG TPA: hypothetical protein VIG52_00330 [Methyloceanibacter sp.]